MPKIEALDPRLLKANAVLKSKMIDDEPKKEEPKKDDDEGGSSLLAKLAIGLGPALLGAAIGGAEGGSVGARSGAEALKGMTEEEEKKRLERLARAEKEQEALLRKTERGEDKDFQTGMEQLRQKHALELEAMRNKGDKGNNLAELLVPGVGIALTKDDAKQLKDASQGKAKLDSQLTELIDLRKKFGAETANREAVSRSKQLSKEILLNYKNLAKLGVLSQADENIINAIIPSDPLGVTAGNIPVIGKFFGDPILSNLEKFKADNDADFARNIALRTGQQFQQPAQPVSPPPASGGGFGLSEAQAADPTERRKRLESMSDQERIEYANKLRSSMKP